MFALNPGGSGAGGSKSGNSQARQTFYFFGQLGLYFAVIRGAFYFCAGPEERKALSSGR
jgi:hypothetical protein